MLALVSIMCSPAEPSVMLSGSETQHSFETHGRPRGTAGYLSWPDPFQDLREAESKANQTSDWQQIRDECSLNRIL